MIIEGRGVNEAYQIAMLLFRNLRESGDVPSRNGPMREMADGPVTTVYRRPHERVLFDEARDANPFFHMFEAIWMLAGHDDVAFPAQFAGNIRNYSDDGIRLNGAYGYRWAHHFGYDQLSYVIQELRSNPQSRRVVLQMWDGIDDLRNTTSKDLPCNLSCLFKIRDRKLHMTVMNRSNDAIWGCYGANAVHFSMLQEFVACAVGVELGRYWQISDSLHIYPELEVTRRVLDAPMNTSDGKYYPGPHFPLMGSPDEATAFMGDCRTFCHESRWKTELKTRWFRRVAGPARWAHTLFKEGDLKQAISEAEAIEAPDWAIACADWIQRRAK
jgi:hypothetical protein